MRPCLLADVRFAKSPEGVYVEGDQGACTIRGGHSYEWLSALAPHLTGEHTLAELTGGRSPLAVYHFIFGPGYDAGCSLLAGRR